jgi:hypothetical protein
MTAEAPRNPEEQDDDVVSQSQSPNGPIQVVVVQQSPADDDRETVGKFVERLLNGDKDEDGTNPNPSARRVTIALSRHNLVIVIALLILAGSQVLAVALHYYEGKRDKDVHAPEVDLQVAVSAVAAASDARQAASAAQKAEAAAQKAEAAAQKAEAAAQQTPRARPDPNLTALFAAIAKNSSPVPTPGEPKLVFVPFPYSNGNTSVPQSSFASGTGEHKFPVLPNFEIIPCSKHFNTVEQSGLAISALAPGGRAAPARAGSTPAATVPAPVPICVETDRANWGSLKFPGPIDLSVIYQNKDKRNLELLDFGAFLTIDYVTPDAQGVLGICPYPRIGPTTLWPADSQVPYPIAVEFGQFWNSGDRKKAQQAWDNGELYITLCTTFRSYDSAVILNRAVYRITRPSNSERTLIIPTEGSENVVLQ